MATQQDEHGVPFSLAHELQQFRLLELPPEIVELLEAPNPPLLSIKSLPPSAASGTPNQKPAYAVLCTPAKSFQLRQVQTSNRLFITQPALEAHRNAHPSPTTRAIASCTSTLELHVADGSGASYLEEVLPLYDAVGGEVDAQENRRCKAAIFADIPLSDGQCQKAWDDLIAFEVSGSSYRPSVQTLAQVWQSINAAALAEAITLDSQFLAKDMAKLVEEEGHPASLAMGLMWYLRNASQDAQGEWSCLDRRKTVPFVGKTLLEAKSGSSNYLTADFVEAWKDSLPEAWRADAELKAITGMYDLPTAATISAKSAATTSSTGNAAPKAASSSRKWHEKFAKTRKK